MHNKVLFIDSKLSGLSGDMFISSFVDMGIPIEIINKIIEILNKKYPYQKIIDFKIDELDRDGFKVKLLSLTTENEITNLNPNELKKILQSCLNGLTFDEKYKEYSLKVLDTLIDAETEVHKIESKKIHLHELSSIDTLFDILSFTACLDFFSILNQTDIYATPVSVGGGAIKFSHGYSNVPAPAVMQILKKYNIPFKYGPVEEELLTPTGAAILANLNPKFESIPFELVIDKLGNGIGQKKIKNFPNVLRILLAKVSHSANKEKYNSDKIIILETNVDDITGESLGYAIKKLIKLGAKDVTVISGISKKNRLTNIIKVITDSNLEMKLVKAPFELTNTLGIRRMPVERYILNREIKKFKVRILDKLFEVGVKKIKSTNGSFRYKLEFDDLVKISEETELPIDKVKNLINKQLNIKKLIC